MPINAQSSSMHLDENTDTEMGYDAEEDSFMEGFSFDSSQPQIDVVSWQNSQPSRDLWELAQRVPNRRNFKYRQDPTLLWNDFNDHETSSSTIDSERNKKARPLSKTSLGSFSRSRSHSSISGNGESSKHDESTGPKKTPMYFAPVEATTVKLRRSTTTQHLLRTAPTRDTRYASLQQKQTKGKEKERQPRWSEPVPEPQALENARASMNQNTFSRSSSSSSSSHRSVIGSCTVETHTPDTSMDVDTTSPVTDPSTFLENPPAPEPAKPPIRLHPLLLQKSSSASAAGSSRASTKPNSPVIPSPTQSYFTKQHPSRDQEHPPLPATQSSRRPALGMCRRAHTMPSSSQQPGRQKFRPPLLSQPPSQATSRHLTGTLATSKAATKPSSATVVPPPPKAPTSRTKTTRRSPSPEAAMEADYSFGDMSFDMDALEETMKQYD